MTTFTCAACAKTQPDGFAISASFPIGWFNRCLDKRGNLTGSGGRAYLLCQSCGVEANFSGGMSPHLKSLFAERGIYFED